MQARGFTLIELLVTIAIVAILLAVGLPSFQGAMRSNRIATTNNELIGSMSLARGEAIKNKRSAGVCAANAAGNGCVASGSWSNGWLVWSNATAGVANLDYQAGTDTVLRYVQPRIGMEITVPTSSDTAPLNTRLIFDARGRARGTTPTATRDLALQPENCAGGEQLKRLMKLNSVGQVTTTKEACT